MKLATTIRPRRPRIIAFWAAVLLGGLLATSIPGTAGAVTTGNGSLVYSPAAGSSFDPAGTTYAKPGHRHSIRRAI